MEEKNAIRELQVCVQTLRRLTEKGLSIFDREALLMKALSASRTLESPPLVAMFEKLKAESSGVIAEALGTRRESLLKAAQTAGLPTKRLQEYDRVGPFKVLYKGRKIRLDLGSETAAEVEVADGEEALNLIRKELSALGKDPFDRGAFFKSLRAAYRMIRDAGGTRDGWAPVRSLYACTALTRQMLSEDFMKNPGDKSFRPYSSAQFVYDLAQFGREGWIFDDEILRSQTPNMVSVASGKTMSYPNTESAEGPGNPIAVIRIEKREG